MNRLILVGGLVLCLGLAGPAHAAKKLFVGGLSWGTSSDELRRHVAPFGPINKIRIVSVDRDGELFARATVEFEHNRDADAAADALDGTTRRVPSCS